MAVKFIGYIGVNKYSETLATKPGRPLDLEYVKTAALAHEEGGFDRVLLPFVGTPEQVAEAMLNYYDIGIDHFLIRGFDPLEDAVDYGRELTPLVRRKVAQCRDRSSALAS